MNEITQVFEGKRVRIFDQEGEPWFALKDVCEVLGLSNPTVVADRLEDDEKLAKPDLVSLGQRGGWLINESGLYSVILRSDKPEAKRFRKWITSEVIPSIRKTGGYRLDGPMPLMPENESLRAALIITCDILRPSPAGKITVLRKALATANLPSAFLPEYADENATLSLSALLETHATGLSAVSVNKRFAEAKIIEQIVRKGKKGEKKFWALTEEGMKYGKNVVSPQNPNETQPHYYPGKFVELMERVGFVVDAKPVA